MPAGTAEQQPREEGGGAQHTYVCKQSWTVGHTVASCSVSKVAELQLVDSPAFPADVDSDVHSQCTPQLIVGRLHPAHNPVVSNSDA